VATFPLGLGAIPVGSRANRKASCSVVRASGIALRWPQAGCEVTTEAEVIPEGARSTHERK